MSLIFKIGKQILKTCLRARSLSLIAFFIVTLVFFVSVLGTSDSAFKPQLLIDSGLSLIKVFGILMVIFITLPVYINERDKNLLAASLSFPVSRAKVLWGIWLGTNCAMLINYLVMVLIFGVTLSVVKISLNFLIVRQLLLTFLELLVISSFSILFSVCFSFVVSVMMTSCFIIIGNLTMSLKQAILSQKDSIIGSLLAFLGNFIPGLALFDLKDLVVKGTQISYSYDLTALIYAIALIVIAIEIAMYFFDRESVL